MEMKLIVAENKFESVILSFARSIGINLLKLIVLLNLATKIIVLSKNGEWCTLKIREGFRNCFSG